MKRRDLGKVVVLTPKGYLTGGEETTELTKELAKLSADGHLQVVINLAETQHLNSAAIQALTVAQSNFRQRGGQLKISGLCHRIENIFVITKLSLIFDDDLYETVDQAMASFTESDPAQSRRKK